MLRTSCLALAAVLVPTASLPAAPVLPAPAADLILTHDQIYTPKGWAEAVAVRKGIILAVGSAAEIEKYRDPSARYIDLKGGAVLPGLYDSYVHVTFAGLEPFTCRIAPGATAATIAETVKACAACKKPGAWIIDGEAVYDARNPPKLTAE